MSLIKLEVPSINILINSNKVVDILIEASAKIQKETGYSSIVMKDSKIVYNSLLNK